MTKSLRSKNLNLVPILHALLKEESVVKAAEELCLTQSTISGALARLREIYNDPLLMRVGRSSQLTDRAKKLKSKVDSVVVGLEGLFEAEDFDPQQATEHFWIAAPDYLVFLMNRVILKKLHHISPNIKIHFVNMPTDLPEKLNERAVDLAICADLDTWPSLNKKALFQDHTVVVLSETHPLLKLEKIAPSDLFKYPNIYYDGSSFPAGNKIFDPPVTHIPLLNWHPKMQVSSSQVVDNLFIAAETETVVRAPYSIFSLLGKNLPLKIAKLNEKSIGFTTAMLSSNIQEKSPGRAWLEELISQSLKIYHYPVEHEQPKTK